MNEALDAVGLSSVSDRLTRHYSTGMKQRLGIANALLAAPDLLVLDEPTNGLDPAGIQDVRELIRDLPRRRNVTVFLSSHLLGEVAQVASHVALLSGGRLAFQGTPAQLQARKRAPVVAIVDRPSHALELLAAAGYQAVAEDYRIVISGSKAEPSGINACLVLGGVAVSYLGIQPVTLEESFLELTKTNIARDCAAR